MKKIIVITGSFNPVTKAHYKILSDAVEKFDADEGLFVETNDKYLHKKCLTKLKTPTNFILSEETRAEMLQSLNKENNKLSFGGVETGGENPNTYKSLLNVYNKKRKQYQGEEIQLFYLFGADKIHGIPKWMDPEGMINLCEFLVYSRNLDVEKLINSSDFLREHRDRIHLLNVEDEDVEDVSSTKVRNLFFEGKDYSGLMNADAYKIMQTLSPKDFPELTPEDLFYAHIKYGGGHGKQTARKRVYNTNKELFNEWRESFLGNKDEHRVAHAYKDKFTVSVKPLDTTTKFGCFNSDCIDVAKDMIDNGFNPVILNIASRVTPCEGYNEGDYSQEDYLCYCSTLSQSLYQFGDEKKKHIKESGVTPVTSVYPMDLNYGGIYSPCVRFFRKGEFCYFSLREDPFDCSVISVGSLSNKKDTEFINEDRKYFDNNGYLTNEGKEIESNKIRTIFRIALDNQHDSIVLSAFGCGYNEMKSDEVSSLFYNILQEDEFKNRFRKVVFAINEGEITPRSRTPRELNGKYAPFYKLFK
ncbi:MAG: TIGR02452 family protein [Clostridia bacterium]|nr:TIGR02452 family protein [Clostridia bacterium]